MREVSSQLRNSMDPLSGCDNIPPASRNLSRKLQNCILSCHALEDVPPAKLAAIKTELRIELSELKSHLPSAKDKLQSIRDSLNTAKIPGSVTALSKEHLCQLLVLQESLVSLEEMNSICDKLDLVVPGVDEPDNENPDSGALVEQATSNTDNMAGVRRPLKKDISYFCPLNEKEWETVPKYLKLRLKLEDVNAFLAAVNRQLDKKYKLLQTKRSLLKRCEIPLYDAYKSYETMETKGLYFVVASDLKAEGYSEKTIANMSTILRHCHKLREIRNGKVVRLVLSK